MIKQTALQKKNQKIFLPEEIHTFLGTEIYIGVSLERKRLIVFRREKNENVNINNLIVPSVIKENRCVVIPFSICKYLEWDFSDSLKLYKMSDCIIIEPI